MHTLLLIHGVRMFDSSFSYFAYVKKIVMWKIFKGNRFLHFSVTDITSPDKNFCVAISIDYQVMIVEVFLTIKDLCQIFTGLLLQL